MSSTPVPPPVPSAPAPAPKKKGLPVLAWVAIGCGGLLVIALAVVLAGGFFFARTVSKAAKDPQMAAAKFIVAANPDLEIVSTNDAAGTITIRNKKTGEVITMDLSAVKEGKIDFTGSKGERVSIGSKDEGGFTVESQEGKFSLGTGAGTEHPAWVPRYPGVTIEGTFSMTEAGKSAGGFQFQSSDAPLAVMDHFDAVFKAAGFEVNRQTFSGGGATGGVVDARSGGRHCTVSAASGEEGTTVMVNYEEKDGE
jgi:hypothetical protein